MKQIQALQALRAVAAVLVVLFHATRVIEDQWGVVWLGGSFERGWSGVDIFFVLSGFIITHAAREKRETRLGFAVRRLIRIYPIYWVVLALLVGAHAAGLTTNQPARGDAWAVLGSALLLPQRDYALEVAWTLTLEMIFYAIFFVFWFWSERALFVALAVWIGAALYSSYVTPIGPWWMRGYVFYAGVAEFGMGAAIAALTHARPARHADALLLAGALGFLAALLIPGIALSREILFGVPAALLVWGAAGTRRTTPAWLSAVGDSSYVLYLVHLTLISVSMRVAARLGLAESGIGTLPTLLVLAGIVAAAHLAHLRVERPLLRFLRERYLPARR